MEKFVSYEKMSKKQQKIVNASKRGNWGNVKPITKVKASAKIYNRNKKQNSGDYGCSDPKKLDFYYAAEFRICCVFFMQQN